MSRLMSCAETEQAVVDRVKTETRRDHSPRLGSVVVGPPGQSLTAERHPRFEITKRREPLKAGDIADTADMGYHYRLLTDEAADDDGQLYAVGYSCDGGGKRKVGASLDLLLTTQMKKRIVS